MFDQTLTSTSTGASVPATQPQIANDSDRMTILFIQDMYDPDTVSDADASNYVVPRIGQLIFDAPNKVIYLCTAVADQAAKYKPTLVVWDRIGSTEEEDAASTILGLPGGFQGEATLGVDYSQQPPRADIDGRVWAPNAAYALLYKGDIVGEAGEVISAQYNNGFDLISNHVPVALASMDTLTNKSIMTCSQFSVTLNAEELPDGSRATVVFYDQAGNMIRNAQSLSVQHTAFLKDHQMGFKYVQSVKLDAPWFTDSTNPNTLNIPINIALKTVELRAIVTYSDGSQKTITIDGSKCYLLGIDQYRPTSVGDKETVVLVYNLTGDEQAEQADAGSAYQIRTSYDIVTTQVNGAYSPKIFTYPVWSNGAWTFKHYLYDLERSVGIDVTAYVTLNESSPTFNPTSYGIEQSLIFNLTLSDISSQYKAWTHVQYTTFVLYQPATKQGRHWDVRYNYTGTPYVGYNVQGTLVNGVTQLSMGGTYVTLDAWLNRLYTLVQPLVNDYTESEAPTPNFAEILTLSGNKTRFAVADWNKLVSLNEVIDEGQTVFLRWIYQEDDGTELQLGITGITVSANPTNSDSDNGTVTQVEGYLNDNEFSLDRTEILAGNPVIATAIARDISGNLEANVPVAFTPSDSWPTTVYSNGDGKAIATIELSVVGQRTIVAATSKGQTKTRSVMVVSPSTALKANSLVLSKTTVTANKDTFSATAVVVDRDGNALSGITVTFQVVGTNVGSKTAITDTNGSAMVNFSPTKSGTDTIIAKLITGSSLQSVVTINA